MMAKGQAQNPELTGYFAWMIEQAKLNGDSGMSIAKRGGVSESTISQIASGDRGAGMKAINAMRAAFGKTLSQLEDEAKEWAKQNPDRMSELAPPAEVPRTNRAKAELAMLAFGHSKKDVRRWADAVAL